jgi:hypothetical protein
MTFELVNPSHTHKYHFNLRNFHWRAAHLGQGGPVCLNPWQPLEPKHPMGTSALTTWYTHSPFTGHLSKVPSTLLVRELSRCIEPVISYFPWKPWPRAWCSGVSQQGVSIRRHSRVSSIRGWSSNVLAVHTDGLLSTWCVLCGLTDHLNVA